MSEARRQQLLEWLLASSLPPEADIPKICREGRSLNQHAWLLGEIVALGDLPIESWEPVSMRERYLAGANALEQMPTGIHCRDLSCPGPGGKLALRLYTPSEPNTLPSQEPLPCILYLHGGGMVIGNLDSHAGLCARLSQSSGMAVLALDYRLAPEHPFPAALEDAQAAWFWLRAHAPELGIHPEKLAVAGDSAGGNLTAALIHLLLSQAAPDPASRPKAQVLLYPWLDMAQDWPSLQSMATGPVLSRAAIDWFRQQYQGKACTTALTDPRLSPLLAPTCGQEPPSFVLTCGFDPLRDMGQAYAQSRQAAGVDVEAVEYPGQIHAFLQAPAVFPDAQLALAHICAWLKAKL